MLAGKPRMDTPGVVRLHLLNLRHRTSEQSPAQRAVGDIGDAELRAQWQQPLLGLPPPDRVLGLEGGDRADTMSPLDGRGRRLAEAELADLALIDQPRHLARGLLDGDRGVDAVLLVEV